MIGKLAINLAGEIILRSSLLIGKAEEADARVAAGALARLSIRHRLEQIMAEEKLDEKTALKKIAKERGVSKSEAYREWQRSK